MNIEFNRVTAIKKAFDGGKKTREELAKITLDYCLFSAITEEDKEELLAYMQLEDNTEEV